MRKASTAIALALLASFALAGCGADTVPEDTLEGFYAQSWENGDTAEEYIEKVSPYVTNEALEEAEAELSTLSEAADGAITINYSDVKVENVEISGNNATAKVLYTIEVSFDEQMEKNSDEINHKLVKQNDEWLITE